MNPTNEESFIKEVLNLLHQTETAQTPLHTRLRALRSLHSAFSSLPFRCVLGSHHSQILPRLFSLLQDHDAAVRKNAAVAIGKLSLSFAKKNLGALFLRLLNFLDAKSALHDLSVLHLIALQSALSQSNNKRTIEVHYIGYICPRLCRYFLALEEWPVLPFAVDLLTFLSCRYFEYFRPNIKVELKSAIFDILKAVAERLLALLARADFERTLSARVSRFVEANASFWKSDAACVDGMLRGLADQICGGFGRVDGQSHFCRNAACAIALFKSLKQSSSIPTLYFPQKLSEAAESHSFFQAPSRETTRKTCELAEMAILTYGITLVPFVASFAGFVNQSVARLVAAEAHAELDSLLRLAHNLNKLAQMSKTPIRRPAENFLADSVVALRGEYAALGATLFFSALRAALSSVKLLDDFYGPMALLASKVADRLESSRRPLSAEKTLFFDLSLLSKLCSAAGKNPAEYSEKGEKAVISTLKLFRELLKNPRREADDVVFVAVKALFRLRQSAFFAARRQWDFCALLLRRFGRCRLPLGRNALKVVFRWTQFLLRGEKAFAAFAEFSKFAGLLAELGAFAGTQWAEEATSFCLNCISAETWICDKNLAKLVYRLIRADCDRKRTESFFALIELAGAKNAEALLIDNAQIEREHSQLIQSYAKYSSPNFNSNNAKQVFSLLSDSPPPKPQRKDSPFAPLKTVLCFSKRPQHISGSLAPKLREKVYRKGKTDEAFALEVLSVEFCKFLAQNKLNTFIGKPAQTLHALKKTVERVRGRGPGGLLCFTADFLAKIVFSLSRGETDSQRFALHSVQSELDNILFFFKSNSKVCSLFFSRLYFALFDLCVESELHREAVIFGENSVCVLLTQFEGKEKSVVKKAAKILFGVCESLCSLRKPDVIEGFSDFVQLKFDFDADWVEGFVCEAKGCFEEAIGRYNGCLSSFVRTESKEPFEGFFEKVLDRLKNCVKPFCGDLRLDENVEGMLESSEKEQIDSMSQFGGGPKNRVDEFALDPKLDWANIDLELAKKDKMYLASLEKSECAKLMESLRGNRENKEILQISFAKLKMLKLLKTDQRHPKTSIENNLFQNFEKLGLEATSILLINKAVNRETNSFFFIKNILQYAEKCSQNHNFGSANKALRFARTLSRENSLSAPQKKSLALRADTLLVKCSSESTQSRMSQFSDVLRQLEEYRHFKMTENPSFFDEFDEMTGMKVISQILKLDPPPEQLKQISDHFSRLADALPDQKFAQKLLKLADFHFKWIESPPSSARKTQLRSFIAKITPESSKIGLNISFLKSLLTRSFSRTNEFWKQCAFDHPKDAELARRKIALLLKERGVNVEMLKKDTKTKILNVLGERLTEAHRFTRRGMHLYLRVLRKLGGFKGTDESNEFQFDRLKIMLRLLKYVSEFPSLIDDEMAQMVLQVNPEVVKLVMPQLFSKLNTVENKTARRILDNWALKVIRKHPFLATFPLLAHSEGPRGEKWDKYLSELKEITPENTQKVGILVKECTRIASLPEDEVARLISSLKKRTPPIFSKLRENLRQLISLKIPEEREKILCQQLSKVAEHICSLNRIAATESKTPHEKEFSKRHRQNIFALVSLFRHIGEVFCPQKRDLRDFLADFSFELNAIETELNRTEKNISAQIAAIEKNLTATRWKLRDISPALNALRGVEIEFFGENFKVERVRIDSICEEVKLIRTKTRPKRFSFLRSDGKRVKILLKTKEDLRLDSFVMQFITTANLILARKSQTKELKATTYPILPLPHNCGFIWWLDDVKTVYDLIRETNAVEDGQTRTDPNDENAFAAFPFTRESAGHFGGYSDFNSGAFSALTKKTLTEANLSAATPRNEIPGDLKRAVFRELSRRVDPGILLRELWFESSGVADYYRKRSTFVKSFATMSTLGYVLGLGDRHLGNILLNAHTGELIHIDYNVCFEEGLQLGVPETVPFRLSKIFQAVLGPLYSEKFKSCCGRILKRLGKHRALLCEVLSPLVGEPLAHWAALEDRRQRQRESALFRQSDQLFAFLFDEGNQALWGKLEESMGKLALSPIKLHLKAPISADSINVFAAISRNLHCFAPNLLCEASLDIFALAVDLQNTEKEQFKNKKFSLRPFYWVKTAVLCDFLIRLLSEASDLSFSELAQKTKGDIDEFPNILKKAEKDLNQIKSLEFGLFGAGTNVIDVAAEKKKSENFEKLDFAINSEKRHLSFAFSALLSNWRKTLFSKNKKPDFFQFYGCCKALTKLFEFDWDEQNLFVLENSAGFSCVSVAKAMASFASFQSKQINPLKASFSLFTKNFSAYVEAKFNQTLGLVDLKSVQTLAETQLKTLSALKYACDMHSKSAEANPALECPSFSDYTSQFLKLETDRQNNDQRFLIKLKLEMNFHLELIEDFATETIKSLSALLSPETPFDFHSFRLRNLKQKISFFGNFADNVSEWAKFLSHPRNSHFCLASAELLSKHFWPKVSASFLQFASFQYSALFEFFMRAGPGKGIFGVDDSATQRNKNVALLVDYLDAFGVNESVVLSKEISGITEEKEERIFGFTDKIYGDSEEKSLLESLLEKARKLVLSVDVVTDFGGNERLRSVDFCGFAEENFAPSDFAEEWSEETSGSLFVSELRKARGVLDRLIKGQNLRSKLSDFGRILGKLAKLFPFGVSGLISDLETLLIKCEDTDFSIDIDNFTVLNTEFKKFTIFSSLLEKWFSSYRNFEAQMRQFREFYKTNSGREDSHRLCDKARHILFGNATGSTASNSHCNSHAADTKQKLFFERKKRPNELASKAIRRVGEKLSVADNAVRDRVRSLVDEAMDEQRLSKMFEGWSPWI